MIRLSFDTSFLPWTRIDADYGFVDRSVMIVVVFQWSPFPDDSTFLSILRVSIEMLLNEGEDGNPTMCHESRVS